MKEDMTDEFFDPMRYEAASALTLLLEENKRLREALEPFAAFANEIDEDMDGITTSCVVRVEFSDIRRARAALTPKEENADDTA